MELFFVICLAFFCCPSHCYRIAHTSSLVKTVLDLPSKWQPRSLAPNLQPFGTFCVALKVNADTISLLPHYSSDIYQSNVIYHHLVKACSLSPTTQYHGHNPAACVHLLHHVDNLTISCIMSKVFDHYLLCVPEPKYSLNFKCGPLMLGGTSEAPHIKKAAVDSRAVPALAVKHR